ncbi:hypothetical protein C7B64_15670 [Merismopedia glauca CCAP 1448/3]|uniref:Uncharacterized protein n=1 Tax=Merismopedia glauca CCAP 1448/3 TaxID=1296344 RepID=A0A2T1C122_9CYAN|nr:hypothetical protein C7B64_15670 [Merismopedia glauca CCAP 1448/3]
MVQQKGILEDLIAEIGLQNSQNILVYLLASLLLLVDLYFWLDLFTSGNFVNLCNFVRDPTRSFSVVDFCQTIFDLVTFGKFLLQLSIFIFANYLLLGNSVVLTENRCISIAPTYNDFIVEIGSYLRSGQCSKKSCLTGSIGS